MYGLCGPGREAAPEVSSRPPGTLGKGRAGPEGLTRQAAMSGGFYQTHHGWLPWDSGKLPFWPTSTPPPPRQSSCGPRQLADNKPKSPGPGWVAGAGRVPFPGLCDLEEDCFLLAASVAVRLG